uniref:Uncharacterized protein n=1 Tax=Arundo donax TaxID=35708 RepID=A0A0A9EAK7_ARUDO
MKVNVLNSCHFEVHSNGTLHYHSHKAQQIICTTSLLGLKTNMWDLNKV